MRPLLLLLACLPACGGPAPQPSPYKVLERFPFVPVIVCDDVRIEADKTVRSSTRGVATLEGDRIRIQLTTTGDEPDSATMVQRVDHEGLWTVSVGSTVFDPPTLFIPADLAPGQRWTTRTTMQDSDGSNPTPIERLNTAVASTECPGGILVTSERIASPAMQHRRVGETLHCPGLGYEPIYRARRYDGDTLVSTTTSTCRAE